MMMRLQHKRPDGELDIYHLKPGRRYHLGRGSSCEIRILDLKLSRKHCVIEYSAGAWRIEDLCSTNGCLVDGQQIVGNAPLITGTRIEAGTTTLAVAGLVAPGSAEDSAAVAALPDPAPAVAAAKPVAAAAKPAAKPTAPAVRDPRRASGEIPTLQQESMPDDLADAIPTSAKLNENDWEPEPASEALNKTGALQPITRGKPVVSTPAPAARDIEQSAIMSPDTLIQPGPALTPRSAAIPSTPVTNSPFDAVPTSETRPAPRIKPVTIRVGRVDGPGEHSTAAETLAEYAAPAPVAAPAHVPVRVEPIRVEPIATTPAPAAATRAPATGGEERTFFITVLGRRVGPLTRSAARELKARELKGTLSQSEIEAYPPA